MGAACRRPARTDADGASVHGASGRSWRWSLGDTGGASSEPLVPLRQLDAVSDWNLLLDASKLAGTPNVAPYVMQARAAAPRAAVTWGRRLPPSGVFCHMWHTC